jgi:hypothetical protein
MDNDLYIISLINIMIIIKNADLKNDKAIMVIATLLFNMELGKTVFNTSGEFDNCDEDFHVLSKNGITYNINGSIGNIIVMYDEKIQRYNNTYLKELSIKLENTMKYLDDIYIKKYNSIKYFTEQSLDFTLVSRNYDSSRCNVYNRKIILYKYMKEKGITCYNTWELKNNIDSNLFIEKSHHTAHDRNCWEHTLLKNYNSLVIDNYDVFNFKDDITFIDNIKRSYLTISDLIITKHMIIYNFHNGGIDNTLRYLKNIKNETENNCDYMFPYTYTPIYKEQWKNIRPIRASNEHDRTNIDQYINILINMDYDYKLSELEEIKNVKFGAPHSHNDICHICHMYLYDDIYVLEKHKYHICICAKCFHGKISYENIKTNNLIILRVKFPRTIKDVINIIEIPDDFKLLLIELSDKKLIKIDKNKKTIITTNYIGFEKQYMEDVLLKKYSISDNKKIFDCKIIY